MLWLRNLGMYFVSAVAAHAVLKWIGSPLVEQLVGNLSTIVLALLAINVQTTAVIAVKLREILDRSQGQAAMSIREFRIAIYEQAALLALAFALQSTVKAVHFQLPDLALSIGALFVLFASVHIFLDTTVGLLIALFPERR